MRTKEEVLKTVFGKTEFRDKQADVIEALINGRNTLCLMPTGMGKSLIFQITTILKGKMCLIISPLLALMDQQSNNLRELGLGAYSLNSDSGTGIQQYKYLRDTFNPPKDPAFLYVSPERMMLDGYAEFVLRKHKNNIGLIVIDEAHCVSQWGHDFRPTYKMIPDFLNKIFGKDVPPLLCLTATLNKEDEQEISTDFKIDTVIKSESLLRSNLNLKIEEEVTKNEDKKIKLGEILERFKGEKVIVYTHIKKRDYGTRKMSEYYKEKGFSCAPFDSDLTKKEKDRILSEFSSGKIKVIFATGAFGMGIDIPDIRCVVHYLLPESIEQYYQEVGRAGRDGKPAYGYLLQAEPNFRIKMDLIKKSRIKREDVEVFWDTLKGSGTNHIGQFGITDVSDDNSQMIIFVKLLKTGHVGLLAKGIQRINCFEAKKTSPVYNKFLSASRKGYLKIISNKTGEDLAIVTEQLYKLFDDGTLDVVKAPNKLLYYRILKPLTDEDLVSIAADFSDQTFSRMKNLERFSEILEASGDPTESIQEYLIERENI